MVAWYSEPAVTPQQLSLPAQPLTKRNNKTVGPNKVEVPEMLFEIVFDSNKPEAKAFVMPSKKLITAVMRKYLVCIEQIEALTD